MLVRPRSTHNYVDAERLLTAANEVIYCALMHPVAKEHSLPILLQDVRDHELVGNAQCFWIMPVILYLGTMTYLPFFSLINPMEVQISTKEHTF